MDRQTELGLTNELLHLCNTKSANLAGTVAASPVTDYFDKTRFAREREAVLLANPAPLAHASELPEPGAFLRRDFAGLPILLTRDAEGVAHAFLNVCRHRGTRLVADESGCKHRFSCPYHAWTWNNQGELIGVPHGDEGFPNLNREQYRLRRLGCSEGYGWIWIDPANESSPDIKGALRGLSNDFDWFEANDLRVAHSDTEIRSVNWKILVEGGIEAYHFRVAHRQTIGPHFLDNVSIYQQHGPHLRSILARRSLDSLNDQPENSWRLRDHAQVLYSIFPACQLLVQSDHVAWVQLDPLSATSTHVRITTLVPADRMQLASDVEHWRKNHAITMQTLAEDFDIGESIQNGLESGANEHLTFGRFESALTRFKEIVECYL